MDANGEHILSTAINNKKENLIDADSKPVGVAVEDTLQQALDKFFEIVE